MKIKWLGHAAFLITSGGGLKILTDPYAPDEKLRYGEIAEPADIVTVSHDHFDHGNVSAVPGSPAVVRDNAESWGIRFHAVRTYHDAARGEQRGSNTIFCFEVDGVKLCHLGDLGHQLTEEQAAEVGTVLLVPVGGFFTIDAAVASQVCDRLKPRVIIPMHFKTDKCDFPISSVDDFLQGKKNVIRPEASQVEFQAAALPASTQITVLKPAL
jgi:L-ascorbate metabolism protein UlaG (beta-lactamase superfamily)